MLILRRLKTSWIYLWMTNKNKLQFERSLYQRATQINKINISWILTRYLLDNKRTLYVVYQILKIDKKWRIAVQIMPTPLYQNLANN